MACLSMPFSFILHKYLHIFYIGVIMSSFNEYFDALQTESVIDLPRNSLDPDIFEFPEVGMPIMHPHIKKQIRIGVEAINELVRVNNYYVIGSILTPRWKPNTDIDVNVEIDPDDITEVNVETLFIGLQRINGKLATGTMHPINFYIVKGEYNLDKTSAAYDTELEKWLKKPPADDTDVNVKSYFNKIKDLIDHVDVSTAELRRDIIDISELTSFDKNQIKNLKELVSKKLRDVEDDVLNLITSYQHIKSLRQTAFDRNMTPAEITKYGHKNKLPENIIYKLLEKYYYIDFIRKLKQIIGDNEELTLGDVKAIQKASQEFYGESVEFLLDEKKRKSSLLKSKIKTKDRDITKTRHDMKIARGLNRKKQHQVPDYRKYHPSDTKHSDSILKVAKKTKGGGLWKLTPIQVIELATKYEFNVPTREEPTKHLGSTGIIMHRDGPGQYSLMKLSKHIKSRGKYRPHFKTSGLTKRQKQKK